MHQQPGVNAMALLAEIGASDCERLVDELLAQPVNALSSFAYVVVAVVAVVIDRRRGRLDVLGFVFALCLAGVGLGSVAFHGPQPAGSRLMHDLPIVLTLLLMLLHDVTLLRPSVRWGAPFVVGSLAAGTLSWAVPDAAAALSGLVLVGLVVAEVLVFRRGARPWSRDHQVRGYLAIGGVLVVAGALWFLGRTDSPVCDPDSIVQFHGLWHLVSATVFGLWWWLALAPRARRTGPGEPVGATGRG